MDLSQYLEEVLNSHIYCYHSPFDSSLGSPPPSPSCLTSYPKLINQRLFELKVLSRFSAKQLSKKPQIRLLWTLGVGTKFEHSDPWLNTAPWVLSESALTQPVSSHLIPSFHRTVKNYMIPPCKCKASSWHWILPRDKALLAIENPEVSAIKRAKHKLWWPMIERIERIYSVEHHYFHKRVLGISLRKRFCLLWIQGKRDETPLLVKTGWRSRLLNDWASVS
jgi:hypothetical protein